MKWPNFRMFSDRSHVNTQEFNVVSEAISSKALPYFGADFLQIISSFSVIFSENLNGLERAEHVLQTMLATAKFIVSMKMFFDNEIYVQPDVSSLASYTFPSDIQKLYFALTTFYAVLVVAGLGHAEYSQAQAQAPAPAPRPAIGP